MIIENINLTYTPELTFLEMSEAIPTLTTDNSVLNDEKIIHFEAWSKDSKVGEFFYDLSTNHYVYDVKWSPNPKESGLVPFMGDIIRKNKSKFNNRIGLNTLELELLLKKVGDKSSGMFNSDNSLIEKANITSSLNSEDVNSENNYKRTL